MQLSSLRLVQLNQVKEIAPMRSVGNARCSYMSLQHSCPQLHHSFSSSRVAMTPDTMPIIIPAFAIAYLVCVYLLLTVVQHSKAR